MENNKTIEINLGEIFGKIFRHKIILLAVTLIITILGTLLIGVKGNNKVEYTSTFSLEYPNSKTLTFPDGSKFQYTDIISLSTLKEVKDKNTTYSNIDVEKMSSDGDITIKHEVDNLTQNSSYTISVKKSYFESKEVAKSFIADLANTPLEKIESIINEIQYTDYVSTYDNLISYDKKINLFNDQLNGLITAYDKAVESFGNITVNNKALNTHKQEVENYLLINPISILQYDITVNGYAYKSEQLAKEYELERELSHQALLVNNKKIEGLQEQISDLLNSIDGSTNVQITELLYPRLAELVEENASIARQIEILDKKISYAKGEKEPNTEFEGKLATYHENVKALTETYTKNVIAIYKNQSSVSFASSSIINETEPLSIIIAGLVSLIVGLIIACGASLIAETIKEKKTATTSNE